MHRLKKMLFLSCLCTFVFIGTACHRQSQESTRKLDFDSFIPVYNRYIYNWLITQQETTTKELAHIKSELLATEGKSKEILESRLKGLQHDQEKWTFRLSLGDYLKMANPSDVPADLFWENGMDQPEIGDPACKKGGVFRKYITTFPPTIRAFGQNSNNSFRAELYDGIDIPLVTLHPETMKVIPGIAREWAVSKDGRTVYFRLNPNAQYSDGEPVRARDYLLNVYLYASDYIVNPFSKQFYREERAQITMYDDLTLSISLPEARIYAAAMAGSIVPSSPRFYAEYGADFSERYQWRFPPTTGAYEVLPKNIIKGASITQTRVKNWWAISQKYYRYRFNPDEIVQTVVRDNSKAFELFRAGQLDTFYITRPELWYDKCEIDPVYNGYIERATFYNRYPKSPFGLYLNVSKPPLNNLNVRIGIQHAMNWQKVIDVLYRGDYQRLNAFNEGYAIFSDPSIKARPYSIDLARQAFRTAGYTTEGKDGILTKPDGTRLSIALSYANQSSIRERMFSILREDAKACGFELRLDGQEETVAYKREMEKQHEISFQSWGITPPVPDFYQFLHSSNAFNEKGNLKTQTNNTFCWGRPDTDTLCEIARTARSEEEMKHAAWKLQRIMHDEAIFSPGYTVDFIRIGSWRWVRWPDCETTHYSPPVVYDPHEMYVFWVDEAIQKETIQARRVGKTFPESNKIIDIHRTTAVTDKKNSNEP